MVVAVLALLAGLLVPASAHVRPNAYAVQCQNNLRQLASACKMYADDNGGRIVSAYPNYGGFTATWCGGNAATGGVDGGYVYGGADPSGHSDGTALALHPDAGSLSLPDRSSCCERCYGPGTIQGKADSAERFDELLHGWSQLWRNPDWVVTNPTGPRDPNHPVYIKETEIRLPKQTWLLLDEDQDSINDGMFIVDVGGSRRFLDLPSRAHSFGCNMSFADGHAEAFILKDDASRNWNVGDMGGLNDWMRLTNLTTHPL